MIPEGSPHRWLLFDTKSRIGGTLLAQGRSFLQTDRRAAAGLFGQAEPSLEEGFREMRPPREVWAAKQKAGERLIALYEAWDTAEPNKGYDQKAGEWRAELAKWQVSTQPASPSAETPSTLLDSTAPSTRSPAPASGSDPSAAPGGDNGR